MLRFSRQTEQLRRVFAEDSGLILDMSAWVVRAACRQLKKWLDLGLRIPVAINCSGKELLHGDPALRKVGFPLPEGAWTGSTAWQSRPVTGLTLPEFAPKGDGHGHGHGHGDDHAEPAPGSHSDGH